MAEKSGSNKNVLYMALVAVLLLIIGVLVFLLLRRGSGGQTVTEQERDPNAAVGQYVGKTEAEIQAELNKIVEAGMFNISINSAVRMEKGSDDAELRIENIAANQHLMRVEILLDDTGEAVYTSGLIEPGYYIQSVPLDTVLEKGSYGATAVFTAYDARTEAPIGKAAAKITIDVES